MHLPGIAATILLLLAPAQEDGPGWTPEERSAIQDALRCILLEEKDLRFEKKAAPSAPRLDVCDRVLDEPMETVPLSLGMAQRASEGVMETLDLAFEGLGLEIGEMTGDLEEAVRRIEEAAKLHEEDIRWAMERGWTVPLEGDNPEMKAAGDLPEMDPRRLYEIFEKTGPVVPPEVAKGILEIALALAEAPPEEGVTETRAGKIIVGGKGDDVYDEPALVIVDLGGDDRYGDGVGGADRRRGQSVSIVIDLGGDDTYVSKTSVAQGAGYFGMGVLIDRGGNDTYHGTNLCQGAGIFGIGILLDEGGDDRYIGDTAVQGAGTLGIGILHDVSGRDRYDAALLSQACAGVMGFGALIEHGGPDLYIAGGRYLHRPLFSDRFRSLSQGFSIGDRGTEAGGGIGLLVDNGGNDAYVADIYGQGSSYWYSLGILVDREGHDSYTLGQYGQGGGIHLSTGVLIDLKGDDNYHNTHGVGQGGGHDYAVGVLLDREGNDYYSGAGLTQGAGNANGLGIICDGKGNDGYVGTRGAIQGHGNPARSYSSIGVLVDLAGKDTYSTDGEDDSIWKSGDVGVGLDRETEEKE